MRFHIQNHHTPENCGTHLEERKEGINSVADWPARCKELGIESLVGGLVALRILVLCLLRQIACPKWRT